MNEVTSSEPTFLDRYKFLGAVINAPWSTSLDHKVIWHVIERYMTRHGNSRTSLRYLGVATGAKLDNVTASLRRLAGNGAISVIRPGLGTRPTEYALHMDFPKIVSVPVDGDTTSVPVGGDASVPVEGDTTAASVPACRDESLLRNPLTSGLTVRRNDARAAPVAGPAASTASAREAVERFEELWQAFPRKHKRAEARAAYDALAPDDLLHAQLVRTAKAWSDCYQRRGTETQWRPYLHNWLKLERYHEDEPVDYIDGKEAAIVRAKQMGSTTNLTGKALNTAPAGKSGLSQGTPQGDHRVKIVTSDLFGDAFTEASIKLTYQIEDGPHSGKKFSHELTVSSDDEKATERGQSWFGQIRRAADKADLQDTSELVGSTIRAIVGKMGHVQYAPA